jgi:hypothetical protein
MTPIRPEPGPKIAPAKVSKVRAFVGPHHTSKKIVNETHGMKAPWQSLFLSSSPQNTPRC